MLCVSSPSCWMFPQVSLFKAKYSLPGVPVLLLNLVLTSRMALSYVTSFFFLHPMLLDYLFLSLQLDKLFWGQEWHHMILYVFCTQPRAWHMVDPPGMLVRWMNKHTAPVLEDSKIECVSAKDEFKPTAEIWPLLEIPGQGVLMWKEPVHQLEFLSFPLSLVFFFFNFEKKGGRGTLQC